MRKEKKKKSSRTGLFAPIHALADKRTHLTKCFFNRRQASGVQMQQTLQIDNKMRKVWPSLHLLNLVLKQWAERFTVALFALLVSLKPTPLWTLPKCWCLNSRVPPRANTDRSLSPPSFVCFALISM